MAEFKVGDCVQLKGGGPIMTCSESQKTGKEKIACQWFAGKKLESGFFPVESLILVKVPKEKGK